MSLGEHTTTANSGYYHLPLDLVFAKQSVSGEQTEPFKSHPEATPSPLVSHQDSRGQLFPGCHLRKINSYAELLTNHMVSSFWITRIMLMVMQGMCKCTLHVGIATQVYYCQYWQPWFLSQSTFESCDLRLRLRAALVPGSTLVRSSVRCAAPTALSPMILHSDVNPRS